ncbi:uncharacterized protein IUM83_02024 [Phytophthora cinnamomi]|uniref:uncharacterized protein n=1 Tax=Phytophthora cinnamomi TaxID=4785 RepID=UPI00355A51A0|nr:hypothetical protein IUM83_02024 [Phytophthora cinnamomi]
MSTFSTFARSLTAVFPDSQLRRQVSVGSKISFTSVMSGKGKCQRKNKRDRKRKRMRGRRRDECNGESSDTVSHWSSDGGSSDIESNCSGEEKFLKKSRKSTRHQINKNKKKPRTTRQQAKQTGRSTKLLENRDSDGDRLPPTQPTVLPSGEVIRPPFCTMAPKMEGLEFEDWDAFKAFEVYCGKGQMYDGSTPPDEKSGPAAVVRNLRQVFGGDDYDEQAWPV